LVLVLAALLAGVLLWWGWRDEPPSAQALSLMKEPERPAVAGDNAYFALLGFDAGEGIDPAAAGKQMLADYESQLAHDPAQLDRVAWAGLGAKALGDKPLHASRNVLELCAGKQLTAVACFVAMRPEIDKLAQENAVLLQRYRELVALRGYRNPATPSPFAPRPPFADLQRASNLVWVEAVHDVWRGEVAGFLARAEQELSFWRMMLREADTLFMKIVATSYLRRDYGLLSDVVASFPDRVKTDRERWLRLAEPLSGEEVDWGTPLRREFRVNARSFRVVADAELDSDACKARTGKDCPTSSDALWSPQHQFWVKTPFYRPQATINRQAENFARLLAIAKEPPGQMIIDAKAWHDQRAESAGKGSDLIDWLSYNPVGKKFLQLAAPNVSERELARPHDLDGYIRLVNLQMQITLLGLADDEVGPFLQTTAAEFTNPYTGRAMDWDAKTRTLAFGGHGGGLPPSGLLVVSLDPGKAPAGSI
jgi:hypothetical protein